MGVIPLLNIWWCGEGKWTSFIVLAYVHVRLYSPTWVTIRKTAWVSSENRLTTLTTALREACCWVLHPTPGGPGPTDLQYSQVWDGLISVIFQFLLEHFVFLLFGTVIHIQHYLTRLCLCGYSADTVTELLTAGLLHTALEFVSCVHVKVAALGPGNAVFAGPALCMNTLNLAPRRYVICSSSELAEKRPECGCFWGFLLMSSGSSESSSSNMRLKFVKGLHKVLLITLLSKFFLVASWEEKWLETDFKFHYF